MTRPSEISPLIYSPAGDYYDKYQSPIAQVCAGFLHSLQANQELPLNDKVQKLAEAKLKLTEALICAKTRRIGLAALGLGLIGAGVVAGGVALTLIFTIIAYPLLVVALTVAGSSPIAGTISFLLYLSQNAVIENELEPLLEEYIEYQNSLLAD